MAAGNIKGMVDYYRTPETQRGFAEKYDQDVRKVTSFADSTKLSMETTVLANATGFHVGRRGTHGPSAPVRDLAKLLPPEQMVETGPVDYSVGAMPIHRRLGHRSRAIASKRAQLSYHKLGDGPFFVFYTPFHLPHLQIPLTDRRAVFIWTRRSRRSRGRLRGDHYRQAQSEGRRASGRRRRFLFLWFD